MCSDETFCVCRNYLAQEAIEAAEDGQYGPTEKLFERLVRPFDELTSDERNKKAPEWVQLLCLRAARGAHCISLQANLVCVS